MNPINLQRWIDEHRELLKPPVGNQVIWENTEFIVMVVGGPNQRQDYHVDPAEELFYQLEGDMVLKVIEAGKARDIAIKQGEVFLLPPETPHSPQRLANTIGLVVERRRAENELDGFQWYCDQCSHKLFEVFVHVSDIVKQLPPIFERFEADPNNRHCDQCGATLKKLSSSEK